MDRIPPFARIIRTVQACPSEWYAWDDDGNWYYLRYRFGRGTVQYSHGGPPPGADHEDFINALGAARTIAEFHHGHRYDGEISFSGFTALWRESPVLDDPPDHLRNKAEPWTASRVS